MRRGPIPVPNPVTTSYGCGNPLALASLTPGEVVLELGSGGGLEVLLAAQRVGMQPSGSAKSAMCSSPLRG